MSGKSKPKNKKQRKSKQKTKTTTLNPSIMESLDNGFDINAGKLNHLQHDELFNQLKRMQQINNKEMKEQCKLVKNMVNNDGYNVYYKKVYRHYKDKIEELENDHDKKIKHLKDLLTYLEKQINQMAKNKKSDKGGDDSEEDDSLKIIQSKYEYKRINDLVDEMEKKMSK